MKRLLVVFGLICCIVSTGFAASPNEDLEIYQWLYEHATGETYITDKYNILLALQSRKIPGAGAFYAKAFNSLLGDLNNLSGTQREAANELAQSLAALIGDEKYATASNDLRSAYDKFSASLVRGEILISLGKLRATEHLAWIIQILKDRNTGQPVGREEADSQGVVVRGAIIALEKFRDESAYEQIFVASIGGYPQKIKDLAKATLPVILEDPSDLLITKVIKSGNYAPGVKQTALQFIIDSANVPNASKSAAAVATLAQGWANPTNDPRQRVAIVDLRKKGIEFINRYGTTDPSVYPLLERSYKESTDENERTGAIATMGKLATEDAVKSLNSYLLVLIGRIQSGSTGGAERRTIDALTRETINALGVTGKASARTVLRQVIDVSPVSDAIKRLAQETLSKLPTQ